MFFCPRSLPVETGGGHGGWSLVDGDFRAGRGMKRRMGGGGLGLRGGGGGIGADVQATANLVSNRLIRAKCLSVCVVRACACMCVRACMRFACLIASMSARACFPFLNCPITHLTKPDTPPVIMHFCCFCCCCCCFGKVSEGDVHMCLHA